MREIVGNGQPLTGRENLLGEFRPRAFRIAAQVP
jgi:hypothetical protein